jgi:hypothetical protein
MPPDFDFFRRHGALGSAGKAIFFTLIDQS